mgnify:CR=1 FL=1
MVERFTALTIGLHSEDPSQPLSAHAAQAFKAAVLPALAWGLVSSLYELSEDLRGEAQAELARLFAGPRKPHQDELILNDEERVGFLYLRMVEAWFSLLDSPHPWGASKAQLEEARHKLTSWLKRPLTELDTLLWEGLGEHYTSQHVGAQRARVVSQAGGHTAGFIRHRLQLFTAAADPKLRKFRLQTENSLGKAVGVRFAAEDMSPAKADAAAHEACGAAFWLARACFGKHIGDQTRNIPADLASERVLLLLLRAAVHLKHDAEPPYLRSGDPKRQESRRQKHHRHRARSEARTRRGQGDLLEDNPGPDRDLPHVESKEIEKESGREGQHQIANLISDRQNIRRVPPAKPKP